MKLMKVDQKTIWLLLFAVVVLILIALMILQTGWIEKPTDNEPILLDRVEVKLPTSTATVKEGWWHDMPTPVSLN
jgi:hypothetical protein